MNYVVLVGTLKTRPEILEVKSSIKYATFEINVMSNFRNSHGKYDISTYTICINKGYFDQTLDKIKLESNLSVKGRLEYLENNLVIMAENIEIIYA